MKMENMFDGVFKNKKVLITGHTGFKGSWLSIWLNELGANVIGYAKDPYTEKDNFVVTNLNKKITDIRGDIRNYDNLIFILNEFNPEIVFHLAAQPLVRLSYKEPRYTYETNVMGTVNILEAVRITDSVKVLVNITSDKCYDNKAWIWGYRENDPIGGYDPYSSSKGCSELVTSAYINSYFTNKKAKHSQAIASVRAGNVIGGGDWAKDRLITDCISSLKKGESIKVRNPDAVRPWQYILEPLRGYLLLASKLYQNPKKFTGAWNFGPNESSIVSVKELVNNLIKIWGSGTWKDLSDKDQMHEAKLLKLDISKARHYLGWEPKLDIEQTLKFMVDWYKNDSVTYDYDVDQIKKYLESDSHEDRKNKIR